MPTKVSDIELVFMGTGTSHGIPMIGCDCPVCTSGDSRDKRTRTSVIVRFAGRTVLVDTAPELRLQCVACGINRVDAVLFTHAHADHVAGLDDLRRFNHLCGGPVECYASADTRRAIEQMFAYVFREDKDYPSVKPEINLHTIDESPFALFGQPILPLPLMHGPLSVLGFRWGDIAYCTDCNEIPRATRDRMEGLDVLILDGLRKKPHPTHFTIDQAVEVAAQIGAKRTFFTHIAHELGHAETNARLPKGMALAHDGQVVTSPAPKPASAETFVPGSEESQSASKNGSQ